MVLSLVIEVPKYSFLKREGRRIEYISPVPCPFNYGSVLEAQAPDGDAPDVLVLGPRLAWGCRLSGPVVGQVRFLDDGLRDDKWVVCAYTPTAAEKRRVEQFFRAYAPIRGLLNRLKGQRGATRYEGCVWDHSPSSPPSSSPSSSGS